MGSSPVRVTTASKSEPYLPGWRWVRILLYLRAISSRHPETEKAKNKTVMAFRFKCFLFPVLSLCRPKSNSGKATYDKKRIELFNSGQISLFEEENEDISQFVTMYESDSDFHDQLKARAIFNRISCPIQVMLESTLRFCPKDNPNEEYSDDMKAHLAWTHSSSLYYKMGYLPWKLDAVRDGVCYVGLVFKKLQDSAKKKGFACSAAQMFLDSGDGVVFRGNIGPWISKNEKTFHLDRQSAKDLLSIAISSYQQKHPICRALAIYLLYSFAVAGNEQIPLNRYHVLCALFENAVGGSNGC